MLASIRCRAVTANNWLNLWKTPERAHFTPEDGDVISLMLIRIVMTMILSPNDGLFSLDDHQDIVEV
jgi:hypothetical protein